jgi:lipopolysaccharide export system protein LptA
LKADNNKERTAVFTGRVVARQDDVTIYSDKLIIYYGENEEQVDKIEATGSVRILQTNRVGTGGHALYENKVGKITLSVNPKVTQDKGFHYRQGNCLLSG